MIGRGRVKENTNAGNKTRKHAALIRAFYIKIGKYSFANGFASC